MLKKICMACSIGFSFLAFVGGAYILISSRPVNAMYVMIPMGMGLLCQVLARIL